VLTRELYAPEFDVNRLMMANLAFWRAVSLSIAEVHHHELTLDEIKRSLDIDSFDSERNDCWTTLREIERDAIEEQFSGNRSTVTVDDAVCDAIVKPVIQATSGGK
jgi:hypothetical protein